MNKKDKNIIVREKLITQKDIVFTCGHKDTLGRIQEYRVHSSDNTNLESFAITENTSFGKMMNVNKFGPTCVTLYTCLLYTSPSPRDRQKSRMPSSA